MKLGVALPFKAPPPQGPPAPRALPPHPAGEEDEYDPFAEEPAEKLRGDHAAAKASKPKAVPPWRQKEAGSPSVPPAPVAAARAAEALEPKAAPWAKPALGPQEVVERPEGAAAEVTVERSGGTISAPAAQVQPQLQQTVAATALDWLSKRGPSRRQVAAAKIAEEYFKPSTSKPSSAVISEGGSGGSKASETGASTPAAKRRRKEELIGFSEELLSKAPASLQTCRSLLLFLEKKLDEKVATPPAVSGPQALQAKLESYAALAGRLESLAEKGGWDARAKRVLDLAAVAQAKSTEASMTEAKTRIKSLATELSSGLKDEAGGRLEALVAERRTWEQVRLRRGWLAWCARLLRAKEAALLAEAEGRKEVAASSTSVGGPKLLGAAEVLEALLAGEDPCVDRAPSHAGA